MWLDPEERIEGNSLRNRQLLTAAARNGDLDEVHSLIRQGVDVNFMDSEGNTALHHAVKGKNFEVVKLLLKNVEHPNSENNKNETPFDIACRFPQDNIIEALEEQILEDSLQLLEEDCVGGETLCSCHNAETLWGFLSVSEAKRVRMWAERSPQTALEQEIADVEVKMKFCLEYVAKVTEIKTEAQELPFEQANALLCFVKILDSLDSPEISDRKRDFFSLFYTEQDRELIRDVGKILLGTADRKIGLEDVRKFIIGDVYAFFVSLRNYVEYVCDELSRSTYMKQLICFEDKLEILNTMEERDPHKPFLEKELEKLRIAAYEYETSKKSGQSDKEAEVVWYLERLRSPNLQDICKLKCDIKTFLEIEIEQLKVAHKIRSDWRKLSSFLRRTTTEDEAMGEEIRDVKSFLRTELQELTKVSHNGLQGELPKRIFEFSANFYPAFVKETGIHCQIFDDFRYKMIYQFHKYKYAEFKNEVYLLWTVLFKLYLAKEIHAVLKSVKPEDTPQIVNRNIKEKFENFKTDHCDSTNEIRPRDEKNDFPWSFLCPDEAIENFVDQYMKYMVIVDREYKEYHKIKLKDRELREVFENFKRLKEFRDVGVQFYSEVKQKFKEVLEDSYLTPCRDFDAIWSAYEENKDGFCEKDMVKQIADTIKNLVKIKDTYQFSSQVIISLYDKFAAKESTFVPAEILSTTSMVDRRIQREITQEIHPNNVLGVAAGHVKFAMQRNRLISNILDMFYYYYQEYHAEYTIEEMFNDEIFLKFIIQEAFGESSQSSHDELNRKYKISAVVKKLLHIDYAAPYIANLMTEGKDKVIVKKPDLITLMEILLKKHEGLYRNHLSTLLSKIQNEKFNLHRVILNIITEQEFCIESMRVVLKNPQHVRAILDLLSEKMDESPDGNKDLAGLAKCLLKALNSISRELDENGCQKDALEILDMVLITYAKLCNKGLCEETDWNMLYARYQKGKIQRMLAEDADDRKTAEKARETFRSIRNSLIYKGNDGDCRKISDLKIDEVAIFLLALANVAFIDTYLKKYEKSDEEFYTLYQNIIKFVLGFPDDRNLPEDFLNDQTFNHIQKSEKYQNLLTFNQESRVYLNILNIKHRAAYSKNLLAKEKQSAGEYIEAARYLDDAIGIFKEIYHWHKNSSGLKVYTTIRAVRRIAIATNQVAGLWTRNNFESIKFQLEYFKIALLCYYICLQKGNQMMKCLKEFFCPGHRQLKFARNYLIQYLLNTASLYDKIASETYDVEKSTAHAMDIYRKLYNILLNGPNGMRCWCSAEGKKYAADICQEVGDITSEKILREELLKMQRKDLGKTHRFTRKTERRVQELSKH